MATEAVRKRRKSASVYEALMEDIEDLEDLRDARLARRENRWESQIGRAHV